MSTAIELAVLALATWPALRLLSIPSTRREYPRIAVVLVFLLALYASLVVWTAAVHPGWLAPTAAIAAIAVGAERWRARPAYGTRRGLPPGRLGLFPRGPWVDDRFFAKQCERFGPIFKYSLQYRPCVCVLGAPLGAELIRANADALQGPPVRFNRFIPKGFLRYMDPADHPFYKRTLANAFAPSTLAAIEPDLRAIARRGLSRLEREAGVDGCRGCPPRPALEALVFEMLVAAFYGVRAECPEFSWLRDRYAELDLRKVSLASGTRDRGALALLEAWVRRRGQAMGEAADRGIPPPVCFLTTLLATRAASLDDETLVGNWVYALNVGRADLTALWLWVLKLLGDEPGEAERLRTVVRSGAGGEGAAIAWRIVRETLRMEQSEYIYRIARREIRFRDLRIPKGWRVRILIREGHRDAAYFPDPDRFDPDRWSGAPDADPRFQPFGLGAHACIGVPITESLSTIFLTELARGFDWQVVEDGPREYGWAHWQPSARLRLALQRVAAPISKSGLRE